ncbi:rod shape-determining protein RodA [Patescibacteria group bacterium AH-259-L05]|nr:rod shape-determining protein RodA [Patescibacteria group bacterium AH-259-L05]
MKRFTFLKRFDTVLFIFMVLLIALGLATLYSLSLSFEHEGMSNFSRQLIFTGIGLVLFGVVSVTDFRFFRSVSYWIYIITILLLVAVLIFGVTFRGVKGWLSLGFFNFQPTELAKLAVILVLAHFWQEARRPIKITDVMVSFVIVLPSIYLILRQPDLGSAAMIIILWIAIFLLVDKNKKHIAGLLVILIIIASLSWMFVLEDYQKDRIFTYINPDLDPLGRGYQITQSIVAVGSGEIIGRGFGLGSQSQLHFLPAPDTDFIFAVLAEEFGLMGSLLLLGLFTLLIYRLIRISEVVYGNFSLVLVLGITLYIFLQMGINIGMNIGLIPVIGVPLPLVSYGGSSLLISMIAVALVESVVMHQPFTKT